MTQVFDPETGVVTPVTVIEAGPCPVVEVKTPDVARLRGRAARVRRGRGAEALEGRARPPEEERRRAAPAPRRVPRAVGGRRRRGRDRRGVRARRHGEGQRHQHRQGLPGHDQAPQLRARPRLARLAQRPQAGIDRRVRDAVARLQGHQDGRPHGRQAPHAGRARRPLGRRRAQPAARQGRRPRPEERAARDQGGQGAWPRPKAPLLDASGKKSKDVALEEADLRRRGQAAPRARDRARGAERRPRRNARREVARARRGRPLQAVAPEGHRPCARRHDPRAAVHRRRRRLPADDAQLRGEGEQEGAPCRAALGALRPRCARHDRDRRQRRVRASRRRSRPSSLLAAWQQELPAARDRAPGRGGADQVVPQSREDRSSRALRARGLAGRLGARRCS